MSSSCRFYAMPVFLLLFFVGTVAAQPVPQATLNVPGETMLGETLNFTVTFENVGDATGYGPLIDMVFPFNGIDGAAGTDTPDGIDFISATYLGTSINTTVLTFPDDGGGAGCIDHPYLVDASHTPLSVCGTAGDKLVILRAPFGSVVPSQPPLVVDINARVSNLADLGVPLSLSARAGFEYGADSLDNPCCDLVIVNPPDPDSSNWPTASTTPVLMSISKEYISLDTQGMENEITVGPAYPRQFRVVVDIADGQVIDNLELSDVLPGNMQFVSLDDTLVHGASVGTTAVSIPSMTIPGGVLTRRFPSITATTSAEDAVMIFSFFIPRLDSGGSEVIPAGSCATALSDNNASALGDWAPIDGRDTGGTDNASANPAGPEFTLTVKTLPVQKAVSIVNDTGVSGASPGDTLEYTLEFQVSDVMAFDALNLSDVISDGQRFDTGFTPTIEVQEHGVTTGPAGFGAANFTVIDHFSDSGSPVAPIDGTQEMDFRVSDEMLNQGLDAIVLGSCVPVGGTGGPAPDCSVFASGESKVIVVFRAIIQEDFSDDHPSGDASVDQGDVLSNSVSVAGNLLNPADLSSTGQICADGSTASVTIARGSLTKSLYAINGSTTLPVPLEIFPGDTVTYRLSYTLTTSDFENLTVTDYLPLPVFLATEVSTFTSTVDATAPAAGAAKYGPADTFNAYSGTDPTLSTDGAANSVLFDYGSYDSTGNSSTVIDLLFTVTVNDEPFADGLYLTNQARVHEGSTNGGDETADAIVQIVLREPYLSVRKGACGTDNPDEVFDPALAGGACPGPINSNDLDGDPTLADSDVSGLDVGDVVSFVISIENQGGSGAFDITIHDVLPSGFCLPGCPVGDPYCVGGAGGLNFSVVRGDGFVPTWAAQGTFGDDRDLFFNGLMLDDSGGQPLCQPHDPVAGSNTLTITYDLAVCDPTLVPGTILANQGGVSGYSGAEGGSSHVDPTNPSDFTDQATSTLADPQLAKTMLGTEINDSVNEAGEAVIGEFVTYQLVLSVPEVTMPGLQFSDTLDVGLAFVDVLSVSLSPGLATANTVGVGTNPSNVVIGAGGQTLLFDFGDTVNSNRDNTVDEVITVVYRAVVLNIASNQAGTTLGNSASASWTGGSLGPVFGADVTVIEPAIAIDKSASPTNADAGDTITYTINVTSPSNPLAANAQDVVVSDVIPAGMTYVSGSLGTGTCATAPSSLNDGGAPTLVVNWVVFPPGGSCQITYQATVDPTVNPGQVIPNTATDEWTSLPGNPGTRSVHNTDSTERDGSGGINDYSGSDLADLTINNVVPAKTIVATSEASTTGADVAVGEIVRYRLVVEIPESTSPNLQLRDLLPAGLQFLDDGTTMVALVSNQGPIQSTDPTGDTLGLGLGSGPFPTAPWVNGNDPTVVTPTFVLPDANIGSSNSLTADPDSYGSGADPYFKLGDLVNPDSDGDAEFIVLEFNALVLNSADIFDGQTRINQFQVFVGGSQLAQSGGINVTVREPAVTDFSKTVNPTSGDAGDVVTYTIGWSNSGSATAFETNLVDIIAAGLTLNVASVSITLSGGAAGAVDNTAGNTVSITIATIPVGGTVVVTYTATIDTTVTPDQVLSNTGDLDYSSLPGTHGTTGNATGSDTPGTSGSTTGERNGSGAGENDYIASDSADVTIGSPQLSKVVVATSETSTGTGEHTAGIEDLTIGETVTFEISTSLPEGTTPQVILTDSLPANATGVLEYVSASVTSIGANLAPAIPNPTPTVSDVNLADGINDTVVFDFGQVVNTPDGVSDAGDEIVIQVVARLKNVANNADGNVLMNSVLLQYGSGLQASAAADVEVVEPSLGITKTAAPTTGDAGDTITFTITVGHLPASTAEAFDLVITDVIPTDMTYAGNVQTLAGASPNVDSSGDPTILFSWDDLVQGAGPLTFTFDVTLDASVQPEQVIVNTATLSYDTLPADDDAEERDHSGSDAASVTITAPGLTKIVASTSVAQTGNGADTEPNLTIGEQATFLITVTVPEGTLTTAQIVDDLPTAPGLLEVVSSQITAMDADMVSSTGLGVGSAGVASDPNTDTRNERVLFDFGTLTNGVGGTNEITVEVVAVVPDIAINQGGLDGLTNTATASSGGGTPVLATAAVDVVEPELAISKAVVNPVSPFGDAGDLITYRITVAHTAASSADAFDVSVSDLLPAGETYVGGSLNSISGPAPTENTSGLPTVVFDWSTIAWADGSAVFEYQVTLDADVHPAQTYTNTATLGWDSLPTGAPGDGGPNDRTGSDSDSADITINAPSLVKITNVTSLGDTGQGEYNVTQEDLAIGETVSYRITTTVPEGVTQTAVITDALQADAFGVLEAIGASVISIGANITTTLPGTPALADNNLGDGLNDTVTFNFGDITNAADGIIDDDDRIVIEVTARVVDVPENTDADDLVNLASLTYATGAPVDDTANIDVVEPIMGISKAMTASGNGVVTLTIGLSNTGTAPAYDVSISDLMPSSMWDTTTIAQLTIPSGFTFGVVGAPGDATVTIASDGGSSPPASSIEPGETVAFQFTAALAGGANPTVNPVLNTAVNDEASSLPGVDPTEREQGDVQADAQLDLPYIELDKSWAMAPGGDLDGSGTPSPGDILRYSITVINLGQAPASNLVITDPINDPNLTLVVGTVTAGPGAIVVLGNNGGDSTIQVDYVSFINGSSDTITYDVQIANPVLAGVSTLVNWASADCDELVPEPSNDPSTSPDDDPTVVPLDAAPDIAVTKTDGLTEVRPGDTMTYTITVSNIGTQGATGVVLTDSIPAGVTFVSASNGGALAAGVVTWPAFALSAGASVQRTLVVAVDDPAAVGQATIVNTAIASDDGANGVDPDLSNNTDTDTDTLVQADLGVSKTDSPDPVLAGEAVTYTVSVVNNGSATDPNVVVVDTLPAAFTFVSAVPSIGSCSEAAGIVTCGLGSMASGATATITIICDVPSETPVGSYTNSVTISGDESDPNPNNDTDTEDTTVGTESDLGITKTDLPDPVVAGEVLTWTLDVVNNGPSDATNVVVTDVLPVGVGFVSASPECSESGGTVTCSLSELINGGTASFEISVRVDADVTGVISNTATVGADQADVVPANDSDSEDTGILTSADVWVTKSGPGSVNRGDVLVFDLVIGNNGPSDALGVVLTDPTPAGLVFLSADVPCASGFPCSLGTIAAGDTVTFSASYTVPVAYAGPDPIVNAASVASDTPDEDPDNNSDDSSTAVDHDAAADMMIVKTGPPSAALGSTVTYHLAVTNNGPNDAANVIVDDPTPAGLVFDSATAPCQAGFPCSLGTVSAGSTVTIDVTFSVPVGYGGTDILNTATVSTDTTETDTTNNSDDETTPIGAETTDLVIDKQGPTAANPGDSIVYTITVTNLGPGDATGVTVTDTFPGDISWVSDTCGNDFSDGIWSIGALAALDSVTCQITAQVAPTAAGAQTNSVVVTGNEPESDLTNNDDEVITGIGGEAADIAVVKTGPARAYPGQQLTFTMVVTNNGPGTATAVQLADPTPAGLVFNSAYSPCTGGFPCALGDIGAGSSVTVNVTFDIPADYSGADPIVNTATVTTTSDDTDPTNDNDDAETDFVPEADLWVTKDDGVTTVVAGTSLVYTITVGNAGPGDVNGGTVTDTFPPQLTAVTWTCAASAGSGCTAAGAGDINDVVTVLSGGTLVYTVNATVLTGATGSVVNTVVVDLPNGMTDPDPGNNTDDDIDVISQESDLAITKVDSADPVMEGTQFFYQLDIINNGSSDATGVVVTDDLPSGLTFVAATPTQGSCSEAGGTVTCNLGPMVVGATAQIIIDVELQWGVVGPLSNTATVTSDQVDGDPSNDSDTETTETLYTELDVLKSVSPPADGMIYRPGEVVTWTIVTTNSGNTPATVATLRDSIPVGAFYVAESLTLDGALLTDALDGDAGAFDTGANAFAVDVATIVENGGTRTVTFNTVLDPVSSNPATSIVNQVFVETPGGETPSDDPSTGVTDDPTIVWVESIGIPVAGPLGLGALILLIGLAGLGVLRRRLN
jgi:uncharacterized repeat protein (TIGR01451 family)/fimbrial isopeptide formation D2 family protein